MPETNSECEFCHGTGVVEVETQVYPGEPHRAFQGDTQKCVCKLNED